MAVRSEEQEFLAFHFAFFSLLDFYQIEVEENCVKEIKIKSMPPLDTSSQDCRKVVVMMFETLLEV
jgi:hypothetical protein